MQLKGAYIFRFGCIGRALEIARELLDPLHVVMLGLLRELADRHVLDHAPTQRADSLLGHGAAPVLSEGFGNPSSQDRTHPSATSMSRDRGSAAAPYRASGLVHWPIAAVALDRLGTTALEGTTDQCHNRSVIDTPYHPS